LLLSITDPIPTFTESEHVVHRRSQACGQQGIGVLQHEHVPQCSICGGLGKSWGV